MGDSKFKIDKLTDDNYHSWKLEMQFYFGSKRLWDVVNTRGEHDPDRDSEARSLLGLHVDKQFLHVVATANTANAAWEALMHLFYTRASASRHQLQRDFTQLTMLPEESISAYVQRCKDMRIRLFELGITFDDAFVVGCIVNGLPHDYSVVRSLIVGSDMARDVDRTLARLLVEEQTLNESSTRAGRPPPAAFSAQAPPSGRRPPSRNSIVCFYCHKPGH